MKFLILVVAAALASPAFACFVRPIQSFPCNVAVRCSFIEDVVWATDGNSCYTFINPCLFGNENCNRRRLNLPPLQRICREVCQTACRTICTAQYDPVCGIYRGRLREFGNLCLMNAHICTTGEVYLIHRYGPC